MTKTTESKIKKLEALAANNNNRHEAKAAQTKADTMRRDAEDLDALNDMLTQKTAYNQDLGYYTYRKV